MSQMIAYEYISKFTLINGKRILEIGGNSSCESAEPFLEAGALEITISGLDHIFKTGSTFDKPRVFLKKVSALDLVAEFGLNTFDIIYGISVLEHIPKPDILFGQLFKTLKSGGFVFLEGAPLWTSAKGHHLWLDRWNSPVTRNYFF